MSKPFSYKIVIVKNKKIYKVFKEYRFFKWALNKYTNLVSNNNVHIKKIQVNTKAIKPVEYELLLLKKTPKNDTISKIVSNEYGNNVKMIIKGGWDIIKKSEWSIEERFFVYGYKKRMDVIDIISNVFKKFTKFYYVTIVLNKIVIYNDDFIEVILCKNGTDCDRLSYFIKKQMSNFGFINFIFLGVANRKQRVNLYDRMELHTGLKRQELFRTSTRS